MLQPDPGSPLQTDPSSTTKELLSESSLLKDGTENSSCKNGKVDTAMTKESESREFTTPSPPKPPYCALSAGRKRFAITIITLVGAVGPLSGTMYLPVLPLLAREFGVSNTSINASVSLFMITFAFAVCFKHGLASRDSESSADMSPIAFDMVFLCRLPWSPTHLYRLARRFHHL